MVKKVNWTPDIWDHAVRLHRGGSSLRTITADLKERFTQERFSVSASQLHTEFKQLNDNPDYRPPIVLQAQPVDVANRAAARQQQYHNDRDPQMLIVTESPRGNSSLSAAFPAGVGQGINFGARGALTAPTTPIENLRNQQGQWPSQMWGGSSTTGLQAGQSIYGQRRISDNSMLSLPHRHVSALQPSPIMPNETLILHQDRGATPWRTSQYTPSSRSPSVVPGSTTWTEVDNTTNITVPTAMSMPPTGQDMTLDLLRHIIRTGYVDHGDERGQPPLFKATCSGRLDAVKLIVDNGANLFTRDNADMDVVSAATMTLSTLQNGSSLSNAIKQCVEYVTHCRERVEESSRPNSFLDEYDMPLSNDEQQSSVISDAGFF